MEKIWDYLEDNNLLSIRQFGFRYSRGTVEQLLLVYCDVATKVFLATTVRITDWFKPASHWNSFHSNYFAIGLDAWPVQNSYFSFILN